MELSEKIKFMRMFKGWSQEEMAEKLGMVVSGYAKIEQGKTDIHFSRLQQITKVLGIELSDLISLNEKNVISVIGSYNIDIGSDSLNIHVYPSESSCQQELEKLRLINEEQRKEIVYLKEIIALLKKEEK